MSEADAQDARIDGTILRGYVVTYGEVFMCVDLEQVVAIARESDGRSRVYLNQTWVIFNIDFDILNIEWTSIIRRRR